MNVVMYIKNIARIVKRKLSSDPGNVFSMKTVLEKNYPPGSSFDFILIGANDGVSHDFLFDFLQKRNSRGIAAEPVLEYFEKLSKNYAVFPDVVLINKAVHATKKQVLIYKADPFKLKQLPDWAEGIASFDPEHHKKSGTSVNDIITEIVNADTLMNMVKEHLINKNPDLFQVDTEGYDYEVLKQIDFTVMHPSIIKFEYVNLSLDDANKAIRLLKQKGYYCFYDNIDIIGVRLKSIKL